ncbi:unnamed protein product [Orchesella dallaii]|uniref:Uncharacterized protein n=1 Tax=Orchesella dallaii TaxID=48710 RepID=A0ABP1QZ61_9HEXA
MGDSVKMKIPEEPHMERLISTQFENHLSELREQSKNISSEFQLTEIHERLKESALEKLGEKIRNDKLTESILKQNLFIAYHQIFLEVILSKETYKKKCIGEYYLSLKTFKAEMWNVISEKFVCNESRDLTPELLFISNQILNQYDKNLGENSDESLITKNIRKEYKFRLEEKMMDKIASFNQKPVKTVMIKKSPLNCKRICATLAITFVSFILISGFLIYLHSKFIPQLNKNESDSEIAELKSNKNLSSIEDVNKQVEQFYLQEFKDINYNPNGGNLLPPKLSLKWHRKAALAATSTAIRAKILTPEMLANSILILDENFHKKIEENIIIGIDFGSKYTRAGVYFDGKVRIIPHFDESGTIYEFMSSYVGVQDYYNLVGQSAENSFQLYPEYWPIFYELKGIVNDFPLSKNSTINTEFTLTLTPDKNGTSLSFQGQNRKYPVVKLISKLFTKVRENTERFLDLKVDKCLLTIPPDLNPNSRKIIQDAGNLAGFTKIDLLDENMSAGITMQQFYPSAWRVLFIKLGERYWGVSVLELLTGNQYFETYRQSNWSNWGYHLHDNLAKYCITEFSKELSSDDKIKFTGGSDSASSSIVKTRKRRVFESCYEAVKSLSSNNITTIHLPNFYEGKDLNVSITRETFETLNDKVFSWLANEVNESLRFANYFFSHVLFAGSGNKMPKVREIVVGGFHHAPIKYASNAVFVDLEDAVMYGAAFEGAKISATQFIPSKQ